MGSEAPGDDLVEKAKSAVNTTISTVREKEGTVLQPAISAVVQDIEVVKGKAEAVSSFVTGSFADSKGFLETSLFKPALDYSLAHPEIFAVGTGAAGALLRIRRGPKKMLGGGVMGFALGMGILFVELA